MKKDKKNKKKMKPLKLVILIVACLLAFVLLVLLAARLYFRLPVYDYYRASEKAFEIPGLSDGFVPQGMDYDSRGYFWVTGYMDDGSASPIYVVEKESGELAKTMYLANEDGTIYNGHAGGIAISWDYVYIAGGADQCIYAYSVEDLLAAEDGASVKARGSISTKLSDEDGVNVACLYVDDRYQYLYALEFYRDPQYQTPESHKMTTPAGDYNQALALAFPLNYEEGVLGVDPAPKFAISLPDKVQGMCMDEDSIYLSTSWSVSNSYIYRYDKVNFTENESKLACRGAEIPLYYLDSNHLLNEYKIPPMSEEIVIVDDRLYTMCESACNKYFFGKLTSGKWCYSTNLFDMAD